MESFSHTRVNNMLLGAAERRALEWLIRRLPAWVTPDLLTLIGLGGSLIAALGYFLSSYQDGFLWLASLGIAFNWFGDSLDGTLARSNHAERPRYGFFLDHSLDVLSGFFIAVGVGLSPYVRFDLALFALAGYLLMSVSVHVRTYCTGVFWMSYGGIGTTEIRLIIILANTLVYFIGNPIVRTPLVDVTVYDLIALVVGISLLVVFVIVTAKVALELRHKDDQQILGG